MRTAILKQKVIIALGLGVTIVASAFAFMLEQQDISRSDGLDLRRQVDTVMDELRIAQVETDAAAAFMEGAGTTPAMLAKFVSNLTISKMRDVPWAEAAIVPRRSVEEFQQGMRNFAGQPSFKFELQDASRQAFLPVVMSRGSWPEPILGTDLFENKSLAAALPSSIEPQAAPLIIFPNSADLFDDGLFFARMVKRVPGVPYERAVILRGLSFDALAQAAEIKQGQSLQLAVLKPDGTTLGSLLKGQVKDAAVSRSRAMALSGLTLQATLSQQQFTTRPWLWSLVALCGTALTLGYVTAMAGIAWSQRARSLSAVLDHTTASLKDSEVREFAFFENATTANCETDYQTGRLLRVNEAMCHMLGYSREELVGMHVRDFTHPSDQQLTREMAESATTHKEGVLRMEKRYVSKQGRVIPAIVNARLLRNRLGEPQSYLTVIVDITERAENERLRDNLVKELAHRVRNTMQLIASLARQTTNRARSVNDYEQKLQQRLSALKTAHDLLFDAGWQQASLREIVLRMVEPFAPSHFDIHLPDLQIPIQHAQSLALAVHELAINSSNFGAVLHGGTVNIRGTIEASKDSADALPCLHFVWSENTPKRIPPPSRSGFGHRMLERLFPEQFQGRSHFEWTAYGLRYEAWLRIPETA